MDTVTVRVPATTANLACGFDTLGCALTLYNTLTFSLAEKLGFSGCPEEFRNEDNLAWQGFRAVYAALGRPAPWVHIRIDARIPVCRGLGSSAALIAAGAVAANALSGGGLTRAELLSIVTPVEGHPDNLAPALLGGLTASATVDGQVLSVNYPVSPSLRFVVLYPDFPLSTHLSRGVLPKELPFGDAVFELSRLALLPRAMETGDEGLLAAALDDRLHQPYRRKLVAEYDEVEALARSFGCRAVCLSGAGPSILCLTGDGELASRMSAGVKALSHGWTVLELPVDPRGAVVLS